MHVAVTTLSMWLSSVLSGPWVAMPSIAADIIPFQFAERVTSPYKLAYTDTTCYILTNQTFAEPT